MEPNLHVARQCIEQIQAEFPHLKIVEESEPSYVEWAATIPKQDGLDFDVSFNLQNNDELHLEAEGLWISFLPCSEPKAKNAFMDSVRGLLSGRYQIAFHSIGPFSLGATLQKSDDGNWKSIGGAGESMLFPRFLKRIRTIRNGQSSAR